MDNNTSNVNLPGTLVVPEEPLGKHYTLVLPGSPPPMNSQTPSLSSVSSPGQSGGHRNRKEKLICRSVTDTSSVATIQESSEEGKTSGGSPPRKSVKRLLPATPRPYRKKHGAVPVKSIIDPLNREAYELAVQEHRKRGVEKGVHQNSPHLLSATGKRPYKRRTPITPPVSGGISSSSTLNQKIKQDRYSSKNLNLSCSNRLTSSSSSHHVSNSPSNVKDQNDNTRISSSSSSTLSSSSGGFTSSQSGHHRRDPYELLRHHLKDKKAPYLPVFGSPNVMPIFKPGQKPWLLLNSLMNNNTTDKNSGSHQSVNDGSLENNVKDKNKVDGSTSRTTKELEIVTPPVDYDDDKPVFTADDRLLFEYLMSTPDQNIVPNPTLTSSSPTTNRLQAPSPSPSSVSGSSSSSSSLRRYSRRRHSSLHPAYEQEHCLYSNHTCTLPLAYGSTYCIKHVPERYSPYYVRCSFFSSQSGKRCPNLQYSDDGKKKFCDMHASQAALLRQKLCRKPRPVKTFKDDISDIKRILEQTRRPQRSEAITYLEDLCDYKLQTQCMEYQMEAKGPVDGTVESLSQFQAEYDSDGGVQTGEQYECLKNAGFYTTEEVVRILQSRLQRLRQLYVKEFDYIKFYYLLKRREFLLAQDKLKSSNVIYTSDPNDLAHCPGARVGQYSQDMLTVKKMNSLHNYKKLRGDLAVLHYMARKRYEEYKEKENAKKSSSLAEDVETESESDEEKTSVIEDLLNTRLNTKPPVKKPKDRVCIYHEGQDKCRNIAMPAMKHCLSHVLHDEKQCMFERCSYPVDNTETCPSVILKRIDKGRCELHRRILVKELPETIKEEDKERLKIKATLPRATKEEAQTMLEDLVAKEINSLEDFDAIVQDIYTKGLDCSDTDYTYSGSDDEDGGPQGYRRKTIGKSRTVNGR